MRRLLLPLVARLLLLLLLRPSPAAAASSNPTLFPVPPRSHGLPKKTKPEPAAPAAAGSWDLRAFHAFLKVRTGGGHGHAWGSRRPTPAAGSPVYWVLHGQLSNPFTGDVIAEVRGLEVLRLLSCVEATATTAAAETKTQARRLLQQLPPSPAHQLPGTAQCLHLTSTATSPWRAVATTLSAKTFKYFHPATGQPLLTFRPNPRAKPRVVPKGVSSLQAVSYALSTKGHLHLVGEAVSGGLVAVQDQGTGPVDTRKQKGGAKVWALWPAGTPKTFELSLLMWPGSKRRNRGRDAGANDGKENGGLLIGGGFPWSSIVQFGASSAQPPCRELYAVSTEPSKQMGSSRGRPRMKYLRYGECPHWCGAGRFCHLALEGTRYDRLQDIPRKDRQLFFPKGNAPGEEEGTTALAAAVPPASVQGFREEAERARRARRKRFFFF